MGKKTKPSKITQQPKRKDKQDSSTTLPGWPGYRTREGRSGYDPIDTRAEAAHTAGTLLQRLFTGEVRNPVYLSLLGILGLVLLLPLVLGSLEAINGNQLPWNAWLFLLITGIVGFVIMRNFIRNLVRLLRR